jgi:hypothetical protein
LPGAGVDRDRRAVGLGQHDADPDRLQNGQHRLVDGREWAAGGGLVAVTAADGGLRGGPDGVPA